VLFSRKLMKEPNLGHTFATRLANRALNRYVDGIARCRSSTTDTGGHDLGELSVDILSSYGNGTREGGG